MKNYTVICGFAICVLLALCSCDHKSAAIRDLENFVEEVEAECQSYGAEEWEAANESFSKISDELDKYDYNAEELKKIGQLKGRYIGCLTKQSIKEAGRQVERFGKELEGSLEGFLDAISDEED